MILSSEEWCRKKIAYLQSKQGQTERSKFNKKKDAFKEQQNILHLKESLDKAYKNNEDTHYIFEAIWNQMDEKAFLKEKDLYELHFFEYILQIKFENGKFQNIIKK